MLSGEGGVAGKAWFMLGYITKKPEGDEAAVSTVKILGAFLDDGVAYAVGWVGDRQQFRCLCSRGCLL